MKYRIFILLVVFAALMISSCGDKGPFAPASQELTQSDLGSFLAKKPPGKFTPYTAVEKFVKEIDPGRQWYSEDNILHVRDRVQVFKVESSEPRVAGMSTVTQLLNFNLTTGNGTYVGKCYHVVEGKGTWEGTLSGKLENFIFSGHGVAQGTGGELEGLILKLWLHDTPPPWEETPESGYIIEKP